MNKYFTPSGVIELQNRINTLNDEIALINIHIYKYLQKTI